jgi:hypothetical protein
MTTHSLDGSSTRIELGNGVAISAPAVLGTITDTPVEPGTRSRAFGEESFDAQLESAGLVRTRIIDVDGTPPGAARRLGARDLGDGASPPVGTLEVTSLPGEGAVVVMEDETGALTWLLPRQTPGERALGAAPQAVVLTFEIPLAPAVTGARGFGGAFKKVIKVFKYPIEKVEEAVGDLVAGFIRRWEAKHRPYLVCTYGPDDYRAPNHEAHAVSQADWTRLAGGRALLFVHGTFSSCDAFFGIATDVMTELGRRYDGRLFAFNHPTMADDPEENARRLLASIAPGTPEMHVDIVCHSRGGLVAREIARLGREHGVVVERIVMVGVPNGGTALADKDHMIGMINRLTTIAKIFPSRAATIVVDALVAAVKTLAHALLDDMAGLRAMNPSEQFVKAINSELSGSAELFAIASNFEPPPGTPLFSLSRVSDAAADVAFGRAENDLVVPTEGAFAVAAPGFPVPDARRFVFPPTAGVIHTDYFSQADTQSRLTEWLQPAATRDLALVSARGLAPQDLQSLRPHVINLSNGTFSQRGGFSTSKDDVEEIFKHHLPAFARTRPAGAPLRIVAYAHGGLINEQDGLAIALKHVEWWKSNGVYPIYFAWETGLFDALGSVLSSAGRTSRDIGARGFTDFTDHLIEGVCRRLRGDLIWGAMKTNAERCSNAGGGAAYLADQLKAFCAATPGVELHAVGHSAGSIFHSYFLPAAKKAGVPAFETLQLLAPAVRVDLFKQRLVPLLGKSVRSLTVYSMTDDYEQRDTCIGVYNKSLLYLIYHALEDEARVPILGLQIAASNDPDLKALFSANGGAAARGTAIWSVTPAGGVDAASRSTSHGGFDDDAATMTSVAARVLGQAGRVGLRPYIGNARQGREWPLSADVERAIAAPALGQVAVAAASAASVISVAPRPASRGAGRRLGLCIGIDKYPGQNALFGCVGDARQWKALLKEQLHFDHVEMLTDDHATRAGIVAAVRSLLDEAKSGDVVVIQYSGHGTSLPDDDGADEADGTDEALVPIDFENAQFITDDDIRVFLTERLKEGVSLTIFMDCCHSGTITRMLGRTSDEPLPGVRARFIRVKPEIVEAYRALRDRERKEGRVLASVDRTTLRWVNFSACDATEKAFEQNGNGDFTRFATALLAGGIDLTNSEFQRRIVREFGAQRRQTPQLDCPFDAEETGLFQFASGATSAAGGADRDRRSGDERRSDPGATASYDRRSGERRNQEIAGELRGLADRIESST